MSYDFSITIDTGGPEPHHINPDFVYDEAEGRHINANYTSNVVEIWARCLTAAMELRPEARAWAGDDEYRRIRDGTTKVKEIDTETLHLADLHGKQAGDIAAVLKTAVLWGRSHLDELRPLEPDNGWGSASGAVEYLHGIARMCEMHPAGHLCLDR